MLGLIAVAALALALLAGAVWLYSLAQARERSEGVLTRLRTAQEEEEPAWFAADSPELDIPGVAWVSRLLWRGGSEARPRSILLLLGLLVAALAMILVVSGLLFGVLIDSLVLIVLYTVLVRRARHYRARIVEQLPGFLENLIRVLSAGNSLEEAMGAAARESAPPIRPLFMSVSRQVKLGEPVDRALGQVGELYDLRDLKIMALAASVNRRYGGSLRGVLKSMIMAIRQRGTAAKELRALTAETRFSALILALIPTLLTSFMLYRNPHFYDTMWSSPTGRAVLISGGVWQIIGMLILWRMVNSVGGEE
ncbi:MAG: type II secretion system F family protein [Nevskia sp.]|nr:type II secretion system F family protein [Nevskia sp.]